MTDRSATAAPFDRDRLDELMDEAGIDLVLSTSTHNVRYLTGGYRFFFFEHGSEAMGASRYLPYVGYPKGSPERAFYVGGPLEEWQQETQPLWLGTIDNVSFTVDGTTEAAAEHVRRLGLERGRIGVERSFLPDVAREALGRTLPHAEFVDAFAVLEELRLIKNAHELELLRLASEGVVGAMLTVIGEAQPGDSTAELAERMRLEQTRRGLKFHYCWVSTGQSSNMAPSGDRWASGAVLCLDSAGDAGGYVADLTRMGCMGAPTPLMRDLLAEVDAVQDAARTAVAPGRCGADVFAAAAARQAESPYAAQMIFAAHGMGLIIHEAPRISDALQPPYPPTHRQRPFAPGVVLSIETEIMHDVAGFVKLEDTVVVTESGYEAFGDDGRRWNVPASAR